MLRVGMFSQRRHEARSIAGQGDEPLIRERLRQDRFLFGMVLAILWVTSFSLAITWYYFRGPELMVGVVASLMTAVYLFHLKQPSTSNPTRRK